MKSMPTRLAKSVRNSTNVFYASSKKRTKKPTPSHSIIFTLMLTNLATLRNLRRFSWNICKRKELQQTCEKHIRISTSVFSALKKLTQKYAYKKQKISIKVPKNLRKTLKLRIKSLFLSTWIFLLSFTHALFLALPFRCCPFSFWIHN